MYRQTIFYSHCFEANQHYRLRRGRGDGGGQQQLHSVSEESEPADRNQIND